MEERLKTRAQAHAGARPRVDPTLLPALGLGWSPKQAEKIMGPVLDVSVSQQIPEGGFSIEIQRANGTERFALAELVRRMKSEPGSAEIEAAAKILHHLDREMSQ